jgi:tetratricopeptide (TPR) repeat protein
MGGFTAPRAWSCSDAWLSPPEDAWAVSIPRSRSTRTLVRLAVIAGLFATPGVVTTSSVASAAVQLAPALQPCVRAQALFDAGYLADAQTAFKADLGKSPCAVAGLAVVKAAQDKQDAASADKRFQEAVALIRRLEAGGFETEARKQTQALLVAFPNRGIPADIRAVDQPIGLWRQISGVVGPLLRLAIEIVAVLLIAVALGKAVVAVVARAVRPSFTIKDIGGVAEAEVTGQSSLLATELDHIGRADGGHHVRRVSASEGDFALPAAITSAYPQAGLAAALVSFLDRILPRRLWEVSATALPTDSARGPGLTVTISRRGGRREKEMTLWEAEFGQVVANTALTDHLERLALPAAVWLGYQPETGGTARAAARLGTEKWRSYAYFAIGERHQENGETTEARRAYYRALDVDASNLGARLNLAGLLLYRRGHEGTEAPDDPKSRLDFADWLLTGDEMRQRMADTNVTNGIRWRWLYLTAVMNLVKGELDDALSDATTLTNELAKLKSGQAGPGSADLAAEMRWPAFVMRNSAQMERDHKVDHAALSEMNSAWWTANTLYNLACYYARAAAHEDKDKNQHSAYRYLRDSIDRATEPRLMLAMAKTDTTLLDVVNQIPDEVRADLTGERLPDPPHTADAERGRGIGIEIREAVKALVHRNGGATV